MPSRWRAYYTEGCRFDSDGYRWRDLPDDGVLGIKLWLDDGQQCIYGFDWYFHIPDTGLFAGNDDAPDEILARYPGAILKRGQWIPSDEWRQIKREMQRDD